MPIPMAAPVSIPIRQGPPDREMSRHSRASRHSGASQRGAHSRRVHSFQADARYCAQHIFCDLCCNGVPRGLPGLLRLCEEHGRMVLPDPRLPASLGGFWDGENLVVSAHLSRRQYRETIPHELVHALSYSPRWVWLNHRIEGWRYDRAAFLEAVARLVGKMFAAQSSSDQPECAEPPQAKSGYCEE